MSETLYLLTICLPLVTIVVIFAMRSVAAVQQARARLAQEDGSRTLAARAVEAQSATAATLSSIHASLADIGGRLASIERVLKTVE